MTATQRPRHRRTRWAITAPSRAIRTLRYLNEELLGAGQAMARSARAPQPGPQADLAEAPHAHPASAEKVLPGV
jgi:hypothetical protein